MADTDEECSVVTAPGCPCPAWTGPRDILSPLPAQPWFSVFLGHGGSRTPALRSSAPPGRLLSPRTARTWRFTTSFESRAKLIWPRPARTYRTSRSGRARERPRPTPCPVTMKTWPWARLKAGSGRRGAWRVASSPTTFTSSPRAERGGARSRDGWKMKYMVIRGLEGALNWQEWERREKQLSYKGNTQKVSEKAQSTSWGWAWDGLSPHWSPGVGRVT